ncbi:MAG: glycosyltransferase family 2 protein [Clostridia bacterium]|nr:glycosyltransferase family 2 protein [Clostridia bacterium]
MTMKISVCIPMYNESSVIAGCAETLSKYMSENFEDWEVIFSDDGSTDGCGDIVRELALPNVRVVGYEKNRGKGCAVRTAMLAAEGDIVMFTDADLAYGTEVIGRVAKMFEDKPDADIIIGSRNISADGYEGYTFMRKVASKAYIKVLCMAGGFKLSDSQCGCKAFRRHASDDIFARAEVDGFAFDFEAILWATKLGYNIAEMPVKVINHRESKVRVFSDAFKMLGDLRKMKKRINKASK